MTQNTQPTLDDARLSRLRDLAERIGISDEELLRRTVDQLIDRSERDFDSIADKIIAKNAGLYRRLS